MRIISIQVSISLISNISILLYINVTLYRGAEVAHVDMNPFVLLDQIDYLEQIQCWIPLYDITESSGVEVSLGVGCHLTFQEDYSRVPEERRPPRTKQAIQVFNYVPELRGNIYESIYLSIYLFIYLSI